MKKKISNVPFSDTKEQRDLLDKVIEQNNSNPSALIIVLQAAQDIYGYLPIEVQTKIADKLNISPERVYSVSTFYSQFSLSPKGKYNVSVCLGTAGYVKGAQAVLDRIKEVLGIDPDECTPDGKFSLSACRCIGACGLAPVMTINEDVYSRVSAEQVDDILNNYKD